MRTDKKRETHPQIVPVLKRDKTEGDHREIRSTCERTTTNEAQVQ